MARFEGYAWNALVKCQDRKHNGGFGIRLEPNDRGTIAVATDGRSLIRVQGDGNGVSARTIPVEDAKELGRVTKRGAVRIDTLDDGKGSIYLKPSGDEPGETMVDAVVMPLVK